MNEAQLLDELVGRFEEPADWDDVLRRAGARRLPRRRLVLTAAVVVAALAVGPALGVLLTRDRGPRLPSGADRSRIAVVLSPVTRRVLLEVAPWKGHDGFCYLVVPVRAGCVPRAHNTVVLKPPLFGWSFDKRIVSGQAIKQHQTSADPWAQEFLKDNIVGSGAYKLDSWQHGSQITLVKNDKWWNQWQPGSLDKIIIKVVAETAPRVQMIERGEGMIVNVATV